jgi:uncharacterized protein (TIGR03084 family)
MLEQARDYLAECATLDALLRRLPEAEWRAPTQFKGWTADDIVGHLHIFDYAADLTLDSTEALRGFFARMLEGRSERWTLLDFTRAWLDGCQGDALRQRWFEFAGRLAARYQGADPARRVAWGGPDMSARSCISSRQMETWSHGQALFDLLGVERDEGDRLRNVAIIGVNTFGWSFANRQLPVPAARPFIELVAPSGAHWRWHSPEAADRIEGSAVDFCRVVTQTRHVADTALRASGPVARHWMSIAQCFAGPPHDPPPPGTRFRQVARAAPR